MGPQALPTTRPADKTSGFFARLFWVGIALAAAVVAAAVFSPRDARVDQTDRRSPNDTALWIAHITDPHFFEEPGKRETWASDEQEDQEAFADAMGFLQSATTAAGRAPDALVITGDFGIDPSFIPRRGEDPAAGRAREVETVVDLLRLSPAKRILLVVGNNDLQDETANPSALRNFDTFFEEVARRLAGTGTAVENLTACYTTGSRTPCVADVRSARFIGFPSASFKNGPSAGDTTLVAKLSADARATRALANRNVDLAIATLFRRLVQEGVASRKKLIVITHEPDIDDPYLVGEIPKFRALNGTRNASLPLSPGVWNVDPAVREKWMEAVSQSAVLAVLAGHLHSSRQNDYRARYAVPFGNQAGGHARLFVGPPLAVKNQREANVQARGLSLYRIAGDTIARELVWLDSPSGFSSRTSDSNRSTPTSNVQSNATKLSISDRLAIVIIGFAMAILGVLMAFGASLKDWRFALPHGGQKLSWLQHLVFAPLIFVGFVGLTLALLLFCDSWADRRVVALWYPLSFSVAAFTTGALVRMVQSKTE